MKIKRSLKYGSMATAMTIVFIVAVVALNAVIGAVSDRYSLKWDMTANRIYDISEDTTNVLHSMTEDVSFYILSNEATFTSGLPQISEIILRYRTISGAKISIEYVDPVKNPSFTDSYETVEEIAQYSIIVQSARRFQVVTLSDLYTTSVNPQTEEEYITGISAEQRLTAAVKYVTSSEIPKAVIISGHGETVSSSLQSIYVRNNYELVEVNLTLEEIPENTELVVISDPQRDYSADEIKKLDTYFRERLGSALVLHSPANGKLEVLERYFEEWGVTFEHGLIIDKQASLSSMQYFLIPTIHSNEFSEKLQNKDSLFGMPTTQAVNIIDTEINSRTLVSMASSSSQSFSKSLQGGKTVDTFDQEDNDIEGPFDLAVMSTYTQYIDKEYKYARILFIGSSDCIADSILSTASFVNSDFFVNHINIIRGEDTSVNIAPKELADTSLLVGASEMMAIMVILLLIPLAVIVFGLVVWFRRKNL